MILIQVILIVGFLGILIRFLTMPETNQVRAWKKILVLLFVVAAIVAVLFPNASNRVAHFVGVGRGADLLLYLLTVSVIFTSVSSYKRTKQEQRRFTELARKVAIIEANNRYKK